MEVAKGFTDVLYTTMVLLFNEIFVPVMTEILSLFYEKAMYVLSHSVSILAYFFLITVQDSGLPGNNDRHFRRH